jgi:RimJ/RimL family protein N-acetyltransferase
VSRSLYWIPFPESLEATRRWAQEQSTRRPSDDAFNLVIENHNGEFAGTIGTHHCDRRNGNFKYGVAVRETHQRKGYASDAIRLVLRYYFEELGYREATAEVYEFNEASIRLHESLAFKLEGQLRSMIFTGGRAHDVLVFGILAEEFMSEYK